MLSVPPREPIMAANGQVNPAWLKYFNDFRRDVNAVDYSGKADKVSHATSGNFAGLNAAGNLTDSGHKDADYADSIHTHDDRYYTEAEVAALFAALVHTHDDRYYTETETDAFLKGSVMALLASVTINAQTLTKQTVYTVPAGKSLVPFGVVPRSPSASLVGLTDMDIGGNAAADDWIQQVSLNAFTATTDYGLIVQPEQAAGPPIVPVKKPLYAAGTVFGIKINTGSTDPATFKAELLGWLV